jgi:hypothetical protein
MNRAATLDKIERAFDVVIATALELDVAKLKQLANATPQEVRDFQNWRHEFLDDWKRARIQILILNVVSANLVTAPARLQ